MPKKWRKFGNFAPVAAECHSINKNQSLIKMKPVVPEKNAKKWRKFWNFTIGCRVPQHKQKSKFDQDQISSSWENAKKWENFETLQLAAEWCHSINKNQSLIKIKPVVPEKNVKSEENFETLQLAAEISKWNFPEKIAKKWTKFWNCGCRVPGHE